MDDDAVGSLMAALDNAFKDNLIIANKRKTKQIV